MPIKKYDQMTAQDKLDFYEAVKKDFEIQNGIPWSVIEPKVRAEYEATFDDEKFVTSILSKELPFHNVPEERFYEITGIVQNFVNRTINEYIYKLYCIILEYLDAIYGFDD